MVKQPTQIACDRVNWAFECPQQWQELDPTFEENQRFCDVCKKTVHLCESLDEVAQRARKGECIAWQEKEYAEMHVGLLEPPL